MKKLTLIALLCLIPLVSGCTTSSLGVRSSEYIICIDGIEYIKYAAGYAGYMAPHLTADENNNPKVIRCGVKEW